MITIKELAKECNVSIATVSNVLNGKGRVGEETAKRILDKAKSTGYVPNLVAKNLKQKVTKTLGIITEDLTVFNCPDIVDGINEYLDAAGYTFILGNLRLFRKYNNTFYHHENYHDAVEEEFQIMKSKQVAGIIYVGAHCREIKCIPEQRNVPVVVAYSYAAERNLPSVTFDDEQGAYEATVRLIQRGHRRIGMIMGEEGSMCTSDRSKGYQKALFGHGILCDPELMIRGDWSSDSGYEAGRILLQNGVKAIFAMNDIMAAGVYECAGEMDLEAGRDFDLIGFDDRDICTAFRPSLSTMALPLHEIGRKSAEKLIDILEGEEEPDRLYRIPCHMIERGSICRKNV